MWKQFVRDYLNYTRKERLGIFSLFTLIVVCVFMPFLFPYLISQKELDHKKFENEVSQLKFLQADSSSNKKYYSNTFDENNLDNYTAPSGNNYYPKQPSEVFYFDPNTASESEWKRLGIRDKTIGTIQKYLSKGGHFYKPDDINKIWGLRPDDIQRLLPYVSIQQKKPEFVNNNLPAPTYYIKHTSETYKTAQPVDINIADTTGFIALPGIGSKLAQRIINFRSKLGGFYSVDQVAETFGLPDSTFQKIKTYLVLKTVPVKKININEALLDDLKAHPYIRYSLANAIIQYRTQHGNFLSVTDLKKIMLITDDIYKKIEPYLTI